jgi:hypothetical protein
MTARRLVRRAVSRPGVMGGSRPRVSRECPSERGNARNHGRRSLLLLRERRAQARRSCVRGSRDSPAVAALAEAIKQGAASGKQVRPPNLRAAGPGGVSCGACRYFKLRSVRGDGACRLYGGFPVNARQVCSSFRPK